MALDVEHVYANGHRAWQVTCPVHGRFLWPDLASATTGALKHNECEAPKTAPADPGALFAGLGAAPVEGSADQRLAAVNLWSLHQAMVEQGFEDSQALFLLGQVVHGQALGFAIANGQNGGESS